jgi:8-oxo-dGTP pyrophosphatase MutT (NUDIX family)
MLAAGGAWAGEAAAAGAIRELREETGYTGRATSVTPPAFTSPGLSSESVALVFATVDETAPENCDAVARPDDGEFVEPLLVPRAEAAAFWAAETARGAAFDAKVAVYLATLGTGQGH